MRSGTSAVAAICHRLGFFAGAAMSPPRAPRWHSDYEDADGLRLLMNEPADDFAQWFPVYVKHRMDSAEFLRTHGDEWVRGVMLKSPLYAPHVQSMIKLCPTKPVVIVCRREQSERKASLIRSNIGLGRPMLRRLVAKQMEIERALELIVPDLTVDFESLLDDPKNWEDPIAHALGLCEADADESATSVIDRRSRV
jgi:hypothetical protein